MSKQSAIDRLEILCKEAYDVVANTMSHYNCMDSLIGLKRFIRAKRSQGGSIFEFRGQQMGYHVFPFFIDIVLKHSSTLMATCKLDDNIVAWLIDKYVDFPEEMNLSVGRTDDDRLVPEFMIRMAFEQLPIQQMTRTLVPRTLFLYQKVPELNPKRHKDFLLARNEVMRNQFRVHLEEVLLCTFALSVIADGADCFPMTLQSEVEWMKPFVKSDLMNIVRSHLTCNLDQYRESANANFSGSFTFVRTEPQHIIRCPIVRFGRFDVAPDPHLMLARMTKQLHDSVYQYFIDNDRIQQYAGSFGEVFKDYIGLILRECFGTSSVFDLDEQSTLTGRKADWLVVVGNDACIFECKCLRFPRELKRTGSLDILASFVDEKIQPAIDQLAQTEANWSQVRALIPQAQTVKTIRKFIVIEEDFQLANVMSDFLPVNSTVVALKEDSVLIVSTLDLETVACSNYSSDCAKVFGGWQGNSQEHPTLEQHVRSLPDFKFLDQSFLDREFARFFRRDG